VDCCSLWRETIPAMAEEALPLRRYLEGRGLSSENLPSSIRFHPRLSYFGDQGYVGSYPALVAKVEDLPVPEFKESGSADEFGLLRIYLTQDGQKAPVPGSVKKALGPIAGRAVCLAELNGDTVCLTEGLETALAVQQATEIPTLCCVSTAGLQQVRLPRTITQVHIWADRDRSRVGQTAAETLAERLCGEGRTVFLHLPELGIPEDSKSVDWLDVLNAQGAQALQSQLEKELPWSPREDPFASESVPFPLPVLSVPKALERSGLDQLSSESSVEQVESALRRLAAASLRLDRVGKAALRETAVKKLARLKVVGSPARLIDAALGTDSTKEEKEDRLQGQAVTLQNADPYPEPVEGDKLLQELEKVFDQFLKLPAGAAEAMALWVVHTYALEAANISPILCLTSPEKRCGKTSALDLLHNLVSKPLSAANVTPAALFRSVEKFGPTLLIDEADTFLSRNEELRGILNSGHRRTTATIVRTVGDDYEPRIFSTWGAKAIALIGDLPATLEDRSIVIRMRRKAPSEQVARLRLDQIGEELRPTRERIVRWVSDYLDPLKDGEPEDLVGLNDRAMDNWRPLLAIAGICGGHWTERAGRAAQILSGESKEADGSARIQLLEDLQSLFQEKKATGLASSEIVEYLGEMEDRPWPEWKSGRPITTRQLARLLKPFGVTPGLLWIDNKGVRGYQIDNFEDVFRRYLSLQDPVSDLLAPLGSSRGAGYRPVRDPLGRGNPNRSKIAGNPHEQGILTVLTDRKGGPGKKGVSKKRKLEYVVL